LPLSLLGPVSVFGVQQFDARLKFSGATLLRIAGFCSFAIAASILRAWSEVRDESIPLADHSMDTVVMTWTGCSIPDICAALREMRRVLSFGGRLLFVEHGRAPEPGVARWQERLDPLWLRFSGGCHLSRKIDDLLADAGFRIERLRTGYIPGPRIMTFLYEGVARFR
jgi:SAM-dependent methyltransferase